MLGRWGRPPCTPHRGRRQPPAVCSSIPAHQGRPSMCRQIAYAGWCSGFIMTFRCCSRLWGLCVCGRGPPREGLSHKGGATAAGSRRQKAPSSQSHARDGLYEMHATFFAKSLHSCMHACATPWPGRPQAYAQLTLTAATVLYTADLQTYCSLFISVFTAAARQRRTSADWFRVQGSRLARNQQHGYNGNARGVSLL